MIGLTKMFTCPYCPRTGEGVIAVDADAAIDLSKPGRVDLTVDLDAGDPKHVVVFYPHGNRDRPCRHVMSLLVDVEVRRPAVFTPDDQRLTYTGNFDHAHFSKDDAGDELNEYLWTELDRGDPRALHPAARFRVRRFERRRKLPRSPLEIWISGTVFLAMQPELFLQQLREGYLRS